MSKRKREIQSFARSHTCPTCQAEMNRMTAGVLTGRKPTVGDLTICVNCTEIHVIDKDQQVRRLPPEELFRYMLMPGWDKVEEGQKILRLMKAGILKI